MSSASSNASGLAVFHCEAGLVVGEVGPVSVVCWRAAVTPARFEQQKRGLAAAVKRHGNKVAFLCIVEAGLPAPSAELRKAAAAMTMSHDAALRGVALVIEGSGFTASATRSVLIGMALLIRNQNSFPVSYFASVQEAAKWLATRVSVAPAPFCAAVAELRARPY